MAEESKSVDVSGKGECYRCRLDFVTDFDEWQERLEVNFRAGYGSIFGDENVIRGVFCQHCVKELLGQWLKVDQDNADHKVKEGVPQGAFQPYQRKKIIK